MKINDKNLVSFSMCDSPIDRDGCLLKRGEVNKSFQKRWFILKGNLLFYFDKKTDKEPIGVIILEGCTIELAENEEQYAFKIVFHGSGNRIYILCADNQEMMEGWMKALACASYDYLKLMVAELQRQFNELAETERLNAKSRSGSQASLADGLRRINPFDRHRHQNSASFSENQSVSKSNEIASASVDRTAITNRSAMLKQNFLEMHNRFGEKIQKDLEKWKENKIEKSSVDTLIEI